MAEDWQLFDRRTPSAGTVLNEDQRLVGDLAFVTLCSFFVIIFSATVYIFKA